MLTKTLSCADVAFESGDQETPHLGEEGRPAWFSAAASVVVEPPACLTRTLGAAARAPGLRPQVCRAPGAPASLAFTRFFLAVRVGEERCFQSGRTSRLSSLEGEMSFVPRSRCHSLERLQAQLPPPALPGSPAPVATHHGDGSVC